MRRVQAKRKHTGKPSGKVWLPEPTLLEERRRQNLKAPVSQLPPEIVLLIISHFKDATVTPVKANTELDLVRATHIYHLWRQIALAAPELWTEIYISMQNPKWALEMMCRSGQSPLNVQVYSRGVTPSVLARDTRSTRDINQALATMKKNFWRCREISLFAIYGGVPIHDFIPTGSDAALLNTLRLDIISQSGSSQFTLSDNVLKADSLRRLYVANSPLDWHALFLRRLTHLTIRAGRYFYRDKPPFSILLSAIPEMHHLEYLDFDDYFSHSNAAAKQVQLPTLKDLRLDLKIDDAASVMSHLTLFPTTNIYFSMKDTHLQDLTTFHAILNSFTAVLNRKAPLSDPTSPEGRLHSVRLCEINSNTFSHAGYRMQAFRESFSSGLRPSLDCAFRWYPQVQIDDLPILDPLIAALPLDRIVELQIIGNVPLSAKAWAEKFGSIETLQCISLGDHAPTSIFEGLVHSSGESTSQIPHQPSLPLFPALTSISMHKVSIDNVFWSSLVDEWCKHLRLRVNIGFPLQQLTFVGCPLLLDRQITLLEDLVEQVVEFNESNKTNDRSKITYWHAGDFVVNEFDWV